MDEKTNLWLRLFACVAVVLLPVIINDLFWINGGHLSHQQEQVIGIVGGVLVGASFIWFVVHRVNRRAKRPPDTP